MPIQMDNPLGTPGGGKFDKEAEALLKKYGAMGVLVVILGQTPATSGMSFSGVGAAISLMPDILEGCAGHIRSAQRAGKHP
jgi:hypothetical protein